MPIMIYPSLVDELAESVQPGDTLNFISCLGGSVDAALKLIDFIRENQLNVHCEFICASAAAVVFLSCPNTRTATKYSRFLLHETRFDNFADNQVTSTKLENYMEELAQYDELFAELIAKNLNLDVNLVSELIHENSGEGLWYNATDLLEKLPNAYSILTTEYDEAISELVAMKFIGLNEIKQIPVNNQNPDPSVSITQTLEDLTKLVKGLETQVGKLISDVKDLHDKLKENRQKNALQSLVNYRSGYVQNGLPSFEDYMKCFDKL
ncbi:MAG: ATP-dependent Clp protease proteolytic subunit [Candidatus Anstonellales archaeon]